MSAAAPSHAANEAPTAATATPATSSSSSEVTSVTRTDKGTTLVSGRTTNDAGEEEEFTIETIPLGQLSSGETEKLAQLAAKVLKYFDDEAADKQTDDTVTATAGAPSKQ